MNVFFVFLISIWIANAQYWNHVGSSESSEGVDGRIYSMTFDRNGTTLFVGGSFLTSNSKTMNYISQYNTTSMTWSSLGSGVDSVVRALCVDSNSNSLYVGGSFSKAGAIQAYGIAQWKIEQSLWQNLGEFRFNNDILVLVFDHNSNSLYAGGNFNNITTPPPALALNGVARWDGSNWYNLGSGLGNPFLTTSLAFDHSRNLLFIAGFFSSASGVSASNIAQWNGSNWSNLGSGLSNIVSSIAVDESRGLLYAVGSFSYAGGVFTQYAAKWNGSNWFGYNTGIVTSSALQAVAVDSTDGSFYIGGDLWSSISPSSPRIAKFNGTNFIYLNEGFNGPIESIVVNPFDQSVYAGGIFTKSKNLTCVSNIAQYFSNGSLPSNNSDISDSNWTSVGPDAPNGIVFSIVFTNGNMNFSNSENETFFSSPCFIGGNFVNIGNTIVNRIAYFNGSIWNPLQTGVDGTVLAMLYETNSGILYVGGKFLTVSGTPMNYIASWNGTTWSPLANGVGGPVACFAFDPFQKKLYAGGAFTNTSSVRSIGIGCWNGSQWFSLAGGVSNTVISILFDTARRLVYAGGYFKNSSSGVILNTVGSWNGYEWSPFGGGFQPWASCGTVLALDSSKMLYAASCGNISRWDGSNWQHLILVDNAVQAMTFDNANNLYVGGYFDQLTPSPGTPIPPVPIAMLKLMRFDGLSWTQILTGANDLVYSVVVDTYSQNLYVGGQFSKLQVCMPNLGLLPLNAFPPTPPPTPPTPLPTPIPTTQYQVQSSQQNRNEGMIIGISVGVSLFVVLLISILILIFFLHWRRKRNQEHKAELDASLQIAAESAIKKFIVKYSELSFTKKLGSGAFGEVWKAEYRSAPVAVKKIHSNLDLSEKARSEFIREGELMIKIKPHPNVIQILALCVDPLCIIMEFAANGNLDSALKSRKTIDQTKKISWMKEIAAGMRHLHAEGIVHKDLAARNILLTSSDICKVSDLGLSRTLNERQEHVSESDTGPVKWMAPESLVDSLFSPKSDVWSFGVVCLEILTQQKPYPNFTGPQYVLKSATLNLVDFLPKNTDSDLSEIISLTQIRNPNERADFEVILAKLSKLEQRSSNNNANPKSTNSNEKPTPKQNTWLLASNPGKYEHHYENVKKETPTPITPSHDYENVKKPTSLDQTSSISSEYENLNRNNQESIMTESVQSKYENVKTTTTNSTTTSTGLDSLISSEYENINRNKQETESVNSNYENVRPTTDLEVSVNSNYENIRSGNTSDSVHSEYENLNRK